MLLAGALLLGFGVPTRMPGLARLLLLAGARLLGLGIRVLGLSWEQEAEDRLLDVCWGVGLHRLWPFLLLICLLPQLPDVGGDLHDVLVRDHLVFNAQVVQNWHPIVQLGGAVVAGEALSLAVALVVLQLGSEVDVEHLDPQVLPRLGVHSAGATVC